MPLNYIFNFDIDNSFIIKCDFFWLLIKVVILTDVWLPVDSVDSSDFLRPIFLDTKCQILQMSTLLVTAAEQLPLLKFGQIFLINVVNVIILTVFESSLLESLNFFLNLNPRRPVGLFPLHVLYVLHFYQLRAVYDVKIFLKHT